MSPYLQSTIDMNKKAAMALEAYERLLRAMERRLAATCPDEIAAAKWDILNAQVAMDLLRPKGGEG
jgi:hypothetical protein